MKKEMTKRERICRIKAVIAVAYVIIGAVVALASLGGAMWLWLIRTDILVGITVTSLNWWIRKAIYIVALVLFGCGIALTVKGYEYLEGRRR